MWACAERSGALQELPHGRQRRPTSLAVCARLERATTAIQATAVRAIKAQTAKAARIERRSTARAASGASSARMCESRPCGPRRARSRDPAGLAERLCQICGRFRAPDTINKKRGHSRLAGVRGVEG